MEELYGQFWLGGNGQSDGTTGVQDVIFQIQPAFWRSFMTELDELDRRRRAAEALSRRQALRLIIAEQDPPSAE